jgi:hypothetical protein
MKKMFVAACAVMVLVSCGKEEIPETVTNLQKSSDVKMRVFTGIHCIDYIGTCFPDVVVNGIDQNVIDNMFVVIGTGNNSDIKSAFSKNKRVLGQYLSNQVISDVIAGTLEVTTTDGDSSGSIHYMVFNATGQSTNWKAVYPFLD